jgi:hypothetical protein
MLGLLDRESMRYVFIIILFTSVAVAQCTQPFINTNSLSSCSVGNNSGVLPGAVSATNPQTGNDPNNRRMVDFTVTTDSSTSNPNFSDENNLSITENASNGEALFGGGTHAKKTFIPLGVTGGMQGSGQKLLFSETLNCYSMSDCFASVQHVYYGGGPINGDEGQAFQDVSLLQQQGNLNLTTISSVTQTTCNTTMTQSVTAAQATQTFTVASTTGCNVNDWVVLAQEQATAGPAESVMKITGIGAGTISGQVIGNYSNGATVTPATVLQTAGDGFPWGQDRVVINRTATAFTTGTVSNIAGGSFTGSGTGWSTSMVGGNSTIVGCVSLTNDDYTASPFSGTGEQGTLKSWYQIIATGLTATNIGIMSTSAAGDAAYHGNGVGSGAYTIRPCAKALRVSSDSRQIILETNSFTWNVNDSIEEAISPYPDVTGFQYHISKWTPGGVQRSFLDVRNTGARTINTGINIQGNMPTGGGADTVPFGTAFAMDVANVGFSLGEVRTGLAVRTTATSTTGGSQTPCYGFQGLSLFNPSGGTGGGSALGTGWCADGNTGLPFINIGPVKVTNAQGSGGVSADLPNVLKTTATLTYTAISAQTCQEQTATVTGSTTSMLGQASPQTTLGSVNLSWSAWVSSSGTVSVRVCNPSNGSITPNAVTWNIAAIIL